MKIIAFGASISKHSINKIFATYTANQFGTSDIEILDLNDFQLPLFSVNIEEHNGIPQNAIEFYKKLQSADLIIISLAGITEHTQLHLKTCSIVSLVSKRICLPIKRYCWFQHRLAFVEGQEVWRLLYRVFQNMGPK